MAIVRFPVSVFYRIIKYPQLLTEHTSAWVSILIGLRFLLSGWKPLQVSVLDFENLLSSLIPVELFGLALFANGVNQLLYACGIVRSRKCFPTLLAFVQWLFVSVAFWMVSVTSLSAIVFSVLCVSEAVSYLSIVKSVDEDPHEPQ